MVINYYNYRVSGYTGHQQQKILSSCFTPRHKGSDTFEGELLGTCGHICYRQKMKPSPRKRCQYKFFRKSQPYPGIQAVSMIPPGLAKDKFVADPFAGRPKTGPFHRRKTTTYENL